MKKLTVDNGLCVYQLSGGGRLRFNPSDPALLMRLEQLRPRLEQLAPTSVEQADQLLKKELNWLLGPGNDLDRALEGVNLFACGTNGKLVLENLLGALIPVLSEGARQCAAAC